VFFIYFIKFLVNKYFITILNERRGIFDSMVGLHKKYVRRNGTKENSGQHPKREAVLM